MVAGVLLYTLSQRLSDLSYPYQPFTGGWDSTKPRWRSPKTLLLLYPGPGIFSVSNIPGPPIFSRQNLTAAVRRSPGGADCPRFPKPTPPVYSSYELLYIIRGRQLFMKRNEIRRIHIKYRYVACTVMSGLYMKDIVDWNLLCRNRYIPVEFNMYALQSWTVSNPCQLK